MIVFYYTVEENGEKLYQCFMVIVIILKIFYELNSYSFKKRTSISNIIVVVFTLLIKRKIMISFTFVHFNIVSKIIFGT